MRFVLGQLEQSTWPEVAWGFSRLNGDGYPVEFAFSSTRPEIRFTAEIRGPEVPEIDRLRAAWTWAWPGEPFGCECWCRKQATVARGLRWGAWVSGAYSESSTRRKVYLEGSNDFLQGLDIPTLTGSRLRMVGLNCGGADVEYYFRRDRIDLAELGRLLRNLGWRDFFAPLRDAVAAFLRRSSPNSLLPADSGYSIAPNRGFTLYTFARSLWGGDGAIRQNLLDLASRHSWDFDLYERVTKPLARRSGYQTGHGVLAWICTPGEPLEVRVGVRPPDEELK